MKPGIESNKAAIGISNVLLDFKNINIIRINTLVKNISQKPKPKKAVQTNFEGFMNGHNAHKKDDIKAIIPQIPINNLLKPCRNVFLLFCTLFSAITYCFV